MKKVLILSSVLLLACATMTAQKKSYVQDLPTSATSAPEVTLFYSTETYGQIVVLKDLQLNQHLDPAFNSVGQSLTITVLRDRNTEESIIIKPGMQVSDGKRFGLQVVGFDGKSKWITEMSPEFKAKLYAQISKISPITPRVDPEN